MYSSKLCKEPVDKLMFGMSLEEFLDFSNFISMQDAIDLAVNLDQREQAMRN